MIKGGKTSAIVTEALGDLVRASSARSSPRLTCSRSSLQHKLRKPDSKMLVRKNATRPFEDQSTVEFLCKTNDAGLFGFASHSKKRPHNLVSAAAAARPLRGAPLGSVASSASAAVLQVLGRVFDGVVLDMFEFGIHPESFKSLHDFQVIPSHCACVDTAARLSSSAGCPCSPRSFARLLNSVVGLQKRAATVKYGSKPMIVFQGEEFETNADFAKLRNFFLGARFCLSSTHASACLAHVPFPCPVRLFPWRGAAEDQPCQSGPRDCVHGGGQEDLLPVQPGFVLLCSHPAS